MKKILGVLVIFFLCTGVTVAKTLHSRIDMIKTYLRDQKIKIELVAKKYDKYENKQVQNTIKQYEKYIESIELLKKSQLSMNEQERILSAILKEVEKHHEDIKPILKSAKQKKDQKIQQKQQRLLALTKKLERGLQRITRLLNTSERRKIVKINNKLKTHISVLQKIQTKNLIVSKNIEPVLKQLIQNIQTDLLSLRKALKK